MSTQTRTYTYTHSVNYMTDRILRTLKDVIRDIGLDPNKFTETWLTVERGIVTWLTSHHLRIVHLEIWHPSDETQALLRWSLNIEYDGNEEELWEDPQAVRHALVKSGRVPADCHFRVVVTNAPGEADVPGWSSTKLRSVDGMIRQSVGTAAAAPGIRATGEYVRRP